MNPDIVREESVGGGWSEYMCELCGHRFRLYDRHGDPSVCPFQHKHEAEANA